MTVRTRFAHITYRHAAYWRRTARHCTPGCMQSIVEASSRCAIEDTDRQRSTDEAIQVILDGLSWLGLDWHDEPVYQSRHQSRHIQSD